MLYYNELRIVAYAKLKLWNHWSLIPRFFTYTVKLLADLWLTGGGDKPAVRVWTLPQHCSEFQSKFDSIQEQLEDLCGMDDLLTGLLSKSKCQILRLAAVFNALFSLDPSHSLNTELSSMSVKAAINFVQVCNEHTAIIGGRKNITTALTCKLTLWRQCLFSNNRLTLSPPTRLFYNVDPSNPNSSSLQLLCFKLCPHSKHTHCLTSFQSSLAKS